MKAPIHVKCARSGELCEECKRKLDSGEITDLDVKLISEISKLEEKYGLRDVVYDRSFQIGNMVFILVKSNVSDLIGKGGKILKMLKKGIDAKIRIINSTSLESVVRDMLYPVEPRYTSVVFKPNGKTLKIVIPKNTTNKLPTKKETIEEALSKILDQKVEIVEE